MIDQAHLSTWEIEGERVMDVAPRLRGMQGVEMVAPFGNALHVSGTDRGALERAIAAVAKEPGIESREVAPSLEDVFIHLMREAGESARPEKGARHDFAGVPPQ